MEEAKTPDSDLSVEWAVLPWRKLEQHQYRLQKRIFKASERGMHATKRSESMTIDRSVEEPCEVTSLTHGFEAERRG
jgi:hypothetical protein